jgi:cysteine desulfuration protein SufE
MTEHSAFASCLDKQAAIERLFKDCANTDQKYQKIIILGRQLNTFPPSHKTPDNIVQGCQSVMYLHTYLENEKMRFIAHSEALISAGLAALLIMAYDQESPQVILKCPPRFLETIGIQGALSPSRSNGLSSLFLMMKQKSLRFL